MVSRVMTLRSNKFGKYEVSDGLYNSLLCVIKVKKKFKFHHISKGMFFMTNTKKRCSKSLKVGHH